MILQYDPADFESIHAFVEKMEKLKLIDEQMNGVKFFRLLLPDPKSIR